VGEILHALRDREPQLVEDEDAPDRLVPDISREAV
jgi:hypothetical protein